MSESPEVEQAAVRKRTRSPAYPSESLESCVASVKKIYDAERRSSTSAVIAAKHLGYSALSGPARSALATLKKFGLLVDDGTERVRVSDDAIKLVLAPDESQRLPVLQMLAQKPDIIREILSENPGGLPSDESLVYTLATDRGFSEEAARILAKVIRETVRFASLEPGKYTPVPAMEPATNGLELFPKGPQVPAAPGRQPIPVVAPMGARAALQVELSDGTLVDVHTSAPLTAETFEELRDYLDVYQKVLQKRARTPADPG
jgi:hypothetical protein